MADANDTNQAVGRLTRLAPRNAGFENLARSKRQGVAVAGRIRFEVCNVALEMLASVNHDRDLGLLSVNSRIAVIGDCGRIEIDPHSLMSYDTNDRICPANTS